MTEQEYYSTLPRKRMGAGIIFFNEKEEILLVKPTYRTYWILPGGVVEKDESPRTAAIREVQEELGLVVHAPKFVCIDWKAATGPDAKNEENMQFLFFGGVLREEDINKIRLPEQELSEFRFFSADNIPAVSIHMKNRLPHCLKAIREETSLYLENGTPTTS